MGRTGEGEDREEGGKRSKEKMRSEGEDRWKKEGKREKG